MNGEPAVLVGQSSATSGSRPWEVGLNDVQAIKRNHSEMVKFYPRDPYYMTVKLILEDLIKRIEPSVLVTGDGARP